MRKPQDMKVLSALSNSPKDWSQLLEMTSLTSGGLKYVLDKLKQKNLVKQHHRGGDYYLTKEGENEFGKRVIIEGIEKNASKIFKEMPEGKNRFFMDIHFSEANVPVGYLFYPNIKTRQRLPKKPFKTDERLDLLSAIEAAIETIYDEPKPHFEARSKTFYVKLNNEQMKNLQDFTSKGNTQNLAGAFQICYEKGINELSYKKDSGISLSENKKRWPRIWEEWSRVGGRFDENIVNVYFYALDLLEKTLANESN